MNHRSQKTSIFATKADLLDNLTEHEREGALGKKLGYAPNHMYIGLECIFDDKPLEYSIIVESEYAIVLTTKRYDMIEKFSKEVRDQLKDNKDVF